MHVDAVTLFTPVPRVLPTWALLVGLGTLFIGVVLQTVEEHRLFSGNDRARLVTTGALGLGFFLSCLSVLQSAVGAYALFLVLAFHLVEGAAIVHFYQKLLAVVESRSLAAAFSGQRLPYSVGKLLVVLVGLMILLDVLSVVAGGPWRRLRAVYTLVVGGTSAIGARYRLRAVDEDLNEFVVYGLVLCIFGGELFDYVLWTEVLVVCASALAFTVGFWLSATGWIGTRAL